MFSPFADGVFQVYPLFDKYKKTQAMVAMQTAWVVFEKHYYYGIVNSCPGFIVALIERPFAFAIAAGSTSP